MQSFQIGFFPPQMRDLVGLAIIAVSVVSFVLNVLLAMGVFTEANRRQMRGHKLWFVGPGLWSFATFVGGVMTAAIYWTIHHSNLGPVETTEPE